MWWTALALMLPMLGFALGCRGGGGGSGDAGPDGSVDTDTDSDSDADADTDDDTCTDGDTDTDADTDGGTDAATCWLDKRECEGSIRVEDLELFADGSSLLVLDHSAPVDDGVTLYWHDADGNPSGGGSPIGGASSGYDMSVETYGEDEYVEAPSCSSEDEGCIYWKDIRYIGRYLASGEPLWLVGLGEGEIASIQELAVLPDGSIVAIGFIHESAVFGAGDPSETTLYAEDCGSEDAGFVARYLGDGTFSWAVPFCADRVSSEAAVLSDGTFVLSGEFVVTATFGLGTPAETVLAKPSETEAHGHFLARYDALGDLVWAVTSPEEASGLAALSDDSFVAKGTYNGVVTFDTVDGAVTLESSSDTDFFARWNPGGEVLWVKEIACDGESACTANLSLPEVSPEDRLFFVCGYGGAVRFGEGDAADAVLEDPSGQQSVCAALYDSAGGLLELRSWGSGWDSVEAFRSHVLDDGSFIASIVVSGEGEVDVGSPTDEAPFFDINALLARVCP